MMLLPLFFAISQAQASCHCPEAQWQVATCSSYWKTLYFPIAQPSDESSPWGTWLEKGIGGFWQPSLTKPRNSFCWNLYVTVRFVCLSLEVCLMFLCWNVLYLWCCIFGIEILNKSWVSLWFFMHVFVLIGIPETPYGTSTGPAGWCGEDLYLSPTLCFGAFCWGQGQRPAKRPFSAQQKKPPTPDLDVSKKVSVWRDSFDKEIIYPPEN